MAVRSVKQTFNNNNDKFINTPPYLLSEIPESLSVSKTARRGAILSCLLGGVSWNSPMAFLEARLLLDRLVKRATRRQQIITNAK